MPYILACMFFKIKAHDIHLQFDGNCTGCGITTKRVGCIFSLI